MILTNGKNKRMETDNGFIKRNNQPFMKPLSNMLDALVYHIIEVTNSKDDDVFGLIRVEDKKTNTLPVAGIYPSLKAYHSAYNLMMRFGMPWIKLVTGIKNIYTSEQLKTKQQ